MFTTTRINHASQYEYVAPLERGKIDIICYAAMRNKSMYHNSHHNCNLNTFL